MFTIDVLTCWQDVEEPEARAAFIWILGEHGQGIQVSCLPCLTNLDLDICFTHHDLAVDACITKYDLGTGPKAWL